MYIILGIMLVLFAIVTIIYFRDKQKIVKQLNIIEKENGTIKKKNRKQYKGGKYEKSV